MKEEDLFSLGGCRREYVDDDPNKIKLFTGFERFDGDEIVFYMTQFEDGPEWIFTDACSFLHGVSSFGVDLRPTMLASLAATYQVKVSENLALFDNIFDQPLDQRAGRMTQCLTALDGVLRMWGSSRPVDPIPNSQERSSDE